MLICTILDRLYEQPPCFYNKIIEAGYTGYKAPWDAFWGQRYAIIIDPDGNHVDLFADAE